MLFPTHLAAAYVLGERWNLSPWLVVAGAALPDLVDKPAAMLGIVDLYHSAGHSLFVLFGGLAVVAVRGGSRDRGGRAVGEQPDRATRDAWTRWAWTPFWIGWASHLLLDAVHMLLNGRPDDVRFLAWPVIRHRPAVDLPPLQFVGHYLWTPSFYAEFVFWVALAYALLVEE